METHFLTPVEFARGGISPSLLGFILTPLGVFRTSPVRIFIDAEALFPGSRGGPRGPGAGRMSGWRVGARRHVRTRQGPIGYHSPECRPGPQILVTCLQDVFLRPGLAFQHTLWFQDVGAASL